MSPDPGDYLDENFAREIATDPENTQRERPTRQVCCLRLPFTSAMLVPLPSQSPSTRIGGEYHYLRQTRRKDKTLGFSSFVLAWE